MIAEMYGKATGCSQGMGGSMHLVDLSAGILGATPIVGGTIPVAVGASFASSMKGKNNVTAVFFGDAAVEEGVFYESVNFAVLKNLPVLFICENNFYSVYTPLSSRQPPREIYRMVEAQGIESVQVEGMVKVPLL
jgi:pyruvate dehydrogenase E1 component alpha subunit